MVITLFIFARAREDIPECKFSGEYQWLLIYADLHLVIYHTLGHWGYPGTDCCCPSPDVLQVQYICLKCGQPCYYCIPSFFIYGFLLFFCFCGGRLPMERRGVYFFISFILFISLLYLFVSFSRSKLRMVWCKSRTHTWIEYGTSEYFPRGTFLRITSKMYLYDDRRAHITLTGKLLPLWAMST